MGPVAGAEGCEGLGDDVHLGRGGTGALHGVGGPAVGGLLGGDVVLSDQDVAEAVVCAFVGIEVAAYDRWEVGEHEGVVEDDGAVALRGGDGDVGDVGRLLRSHRAAEGVLAAFVGDLGVGGGRGEGEREGEDSGEGSGEGGGEGSERGGRHRACSIGWRDGSAREHAAGQSGEVGVEAGGGVGGAVGREACGGVGGRTAKGKQGPGEARARGFEVSVPIG